MTALQGTLVVFCTLLPVALSCGMVTHDEIAHRSAVQYASTAYPEYREVILNNQDAFQAGAPFPDWGYSCGYHSAGEAAHWEPFQKAAVAHIRATYSKPWSATAQKTIAFLLGIGSHYIADLNWHGLGQSYPRWSTPLGRGFLRALGGTNYGCNGTLCETAHLAGDTGGEFVVDYQFDRTWLVGQWYLPVDDVVAIYKMLNYTIPGEAMEKCVMKFFLAVQAEKFIGSILFPLFATKSPYLVDTVQDHPVGGLDDNAVFTTWKWDLVTGWLEGNSSDTAAPDVTKPLPLVPETGTPDYERFVQSMKMDGMQARASFKRSQRIAELFGVAVNAERVGNGLVLSRLDTSHLKPHPLVSNNSTCSRRVMRQAVAPCLQKGSPVEAELCLLKVLEEAGSHAAWHECAPEVSSVPHRMPVSMMQSHARTPWEYYGTSFAKGDIDGDGYTDIAVGAPGWGGDGALRVGRVYVYYGSANGPSTEPVVLHDPQAPADNRQFGWGVTIVDLNKDGVGDLVVSSPTARGRRFVEGYAWDDWRGQVAVYLSTKGSRLTSASTPSSVIVPDGHEEDANLGRQLHAVDLDGDGHDDLVIGAQYAYGGNGQSNQAPSNPYQQGKTFVNRGMVAVFLSSTFTSKQNASINVNSADWIQRGERDFAYFGGSLASHSSPTGAYLIVSAAEDNTATGAVYGYAWVKGQPRLVFHITGAANKTSFGKGLAVGSPYGDGSMYLLVSAVTDTPSDDVLLTHAGTVYVFPLATLQGNMTLSSLVSQAKTTISGEQAFARIGYTIACRDVDGDGVDEVYLTEPMATTGVLSSIGGHEAGRIIAFTALPAGDVKGRTQASWYSDGLKAGGRLGASAMAFADLDNDGVPELLAGAPRSFIDDRDELPQVGAVFGFSLK